MIDKLMSLEIVDLILFLVKIIILAVMWTVIMTLPFIPKVLKNANQQMESKTCALSIRYLSSRWQTESEPRARVK